MEHFTFSCPSPEGRVIPSFRSLRAMWNGWRDGRLGYPSTADPEPMSFERRLVAKIEGSIRELTARWRNADAELHSRHVRLQAEAATLARRSAELRQEKEKLAAQNAQAEAAFDAARAEMHLSGLLYVVILAILTVVEVPLTASALQVFGFNLAFAYLLAAGLGVLLAFATHLLGDQLRRRQPGTERVLSALLTFLSLAAIVGIAYTRERFLARADAASVLGVQIDPTAVTLTFLAFNGLFLVVGAVASYAYHSPTYASARSKLRALQNALRGTTETLASLERRADEVAVEIGTIAVARQAGLDQLRARAVAIRHHFQVLIEVYRSANLRARARTHGTERPNAFLALPSLDSIKDIPFSLTWDIGPPASISHALDAGLVLPATVVPSRPAAPPTLERAGKRPGSGNGSATKVVCLFALASLPFVTGCEKAPPTTAAVVLFDLSASVDSTIRDRYLEWLKTMLTPGDGWQAEPGDVVVVQRVTDASLNESDTVRIEAPRFDPLAGSLLVARARAKKQFERAPERIGEMVRAAPSVQQSKIMDAVMVAAPTLRTLGRDHSTLIVLSDMIEESDHYNFTLDRLTPARIKQVIDGERARGRLPDLRGVQVYVFGAAVGKYASRLSSDRLLAIRDFWVAYFQSCGAIFNEDRYLPTLVASPLVHSGS